MTPTELVTDENITESAAQAVGKLNISKPLKKVIGAVLGVISGAIVYLTVVGDDK